MASLSEREEVRDALRARAVKGLRLQLMIERSLDEIRKAKALADEIGLPGHELRRLYAVSDAIYSLVTRDISPQEIE